MKLCLKETDEMLGQSCGGGDIISLFFVPVFRHWTMSLKLRLLKPGTVAHSLSSLLLSLTTLHMTSQLVPQHQGILYLK